VQTSPPHDQYEFHVAPLVPNVEPPLRAPPRPSSFKTDELASEEPSIGRRIFRNVARFSIAVLIGIGATVAWQSHGNKAKETIGAWAPALGWLSPVSTQPPSDNLVAPQSSVTSQSAPATQTAGATPAVTSHDLAQQLEPVVRDLAVVRRGLEQIAAKQDQMAQTLATLQAAEQEIRQKISSLAAPRTAAPRKSTQAAVPSAVAQSSSATSPPPSVQPPAPPR
jgi:hypothetical protein